jgi:hypothetical protein
MKIVHHEHIQCSVPQNEDWFAVTLLMSTVEVTRTMQNHHWSAVLMILHIHVCSQLWQ